RGRRATIGRRREGPEGGPVGRGAGGLHDRQEAGGLRGEGRGGRARRHPRSGSGAAAGRGVYFDLRLAPLVPPRGRVLIGRPDASRRASPSRGPAGLRERLRAAVPRRLTLVTGAPGWLGSRPVRVLAHGLPDVPALSERDHERRIRCLVMPGAPADALTPIAPDLELVPGDIR